MRFTSTFTAVSTILLVAASPLPASDTDKAITYTASDASNFLRSMLPRCLNLCEPTIGYEHCYNICANEALKFQHDLGMWGNINEELYRKERAAAECDKSVELVDPDRSGMCTQDLQNFYRSFMTMDLDQYLKDRIATWNV